MRTILRVPRYSMEKERGIAATPTGFPCSSHSGKAFATSISLLCSGSRLFITETATWVRQGVSFSLVRQCSLICGGQEPMSHAAVESKNVSRWSAPDVVISIPMYLNKKLDRWLATSYKLGRSHWIQSTYGADADVSRTQTTTWLDYSKGDQLYTIMHLYHQR